MSRGFDALVAAGGYARRLGATGPKSLMRIGQEPLIVETIRELLRSRCRKILVANNRPEYSPHLAEILWQFPDVSLVKSSDHQSTFMLLSEFYSLLSEKVIFTYGHAPRDFQHISRLAECEGSLVCSSYESSSRRDPIVVGRLFVEPPFLLDKDLVTKSSSMTWREFVIEHKSDASFVYSNELPEFNSWAEFEQVLHQRSCGNFGLRL